MYPVDAKALVEDVQGLVSLPEVAMKINDMVDDPEVTIEDIGKLISQDPALTVRVLGIANSPYYGFSSEISTISRAVTVLGTKQIRDVVLSTAVTNAFDGIPIDLISVDDFWYHSVYCGLLAQELANIHNPPQGESIFVAGLLHDIGHLVMLNKIPQLMQDALLITLQGECDTLIEAERQVIGSDHVEVGAELARTWHLPAYLVTCIEYHHDPSRATEFQQEVALVHIANAVASLPFEGEFDEADLQQAIHPDSWALAGLQPSELTDAAHSAQEKIQEMKQLYFPT